MAVTIPSNSLINNFSVSNIISHLRSKRRSNSNTNGVKNQHVAPANTRPPLIPSPLPLVLPVHQHTLPNLGWTTITFPQPTNSNPSTSSEELPGPHPLQAAYEALFTASQAFFALPVSEKQKWAHKLGTEEGWTSIPGEKEFITLRTLEYCPNVLRVPAKRYWDLMGAHLSSTMDRIATSLDLPNDDETGLRPLIGPCASMPVTDLDKTATMLRFFRYETHEPKVVAEPHSDLGLLSVVVGDVPGLEVWDGHGWFPIEREVRGAGMQGASLLVGRHLEKLTNGRWVAGGHRVVSYGRGVSKSIRIQHQSVARKSDGKCLIQDDDKDKYRYSIVFVLRAHEPVIVNSDALETAITGRWQSPVKGATAGQMYEEIKGKCFNINIGYEERERQRRNVKNKKKEKEKETEK